MNRRLVYVSIYECPSVYAAIDAALSEDPATERVEL
jgi:hypothetical protein